MNAFFKGKNVLITGGLGFLGSSLAVKLVSLGGRVTIIDNLDPLYGGNRFNLGETAAEMKVVIDDVRNLAVMLPLIERCDLVFHMAGQVSYIDSLSMPYEDLDLNARATLGVLECCRKANPKARVLFASSRMIYGRVDGGAIVETCPTNPLTLYGIHKLTAEKYVLMYFKDFGIPGTVLRLTNPYGPRQQIKHNKYSLVGWFVRQAMEGQTIRIFGEGSQLRDYIFVDDIVAAMLRCAQSPDSAGEVVNVGSGSSTAFSDMVRTVIACVGRGRMEFVPWPANYEKIETGDIAVDISKLRRLTSWQPQCSLEEGIRRTYDYYAHHLAHYVSSADDERRR